ncbi:MAG: type IV secretion system protein VirB4 [Candidatus Midichloriaceae bacterium]|jgi:type IV secretion system protein VirB4
MLGIGKEKKSIFNENIADLIPVVCHYDSKTLLTKNGDLLQIISVEGFVKNGEEVTGLDLREEVRKTLKEYVTDPEIAIYIHVCRDYKDIMPKKYDEKENAIVQGIENKWCEKNNWDKQLVNTIYITLLKKGPRIKFFNIADFISSIIPFALKKKYSKYFTKAITELDKVSHNIAESLGIFSTKILTVFEKNQELYSEPLSFYHYLMCFVKSDIKIEKIDFSSLLSDIKLESDFNVTTIYYENTTKFVALYSIEVPFETKLNVLESLLNIPSKFIITELITFVSSEKALHSVKKYKSILDSIKNTEISDVIALNEFIKSDTKQKNDFCSSQITFAIYADNYQDLEDISIDFAKKLNVSGIKAVREDFNMQAALLNSLPGNTFFSNRSNMLPTLFTSSLCNIHSKKIGNYNGSKWGDPVTILKTIYGKYYHFNFHDKENGNTIIVGPKYSGKSTITNFLLAQSLKFDIKLLYLDLEGRAKDFIKGIGGSVLELSEEKESEIQFDIMNLEGEYFADFLLKICSLDDPFRYKNAKYIKKFRTLPSLLKDVDNTEDKIKIIDKFIYPSQIKLRILESEN